MFVLPCVCALVTSVCSCGLHYRGPLLYVYFAVSLAKSSIKREHLLHQTMIITTKHTPDYVFFSSNLYSKHWHMVFVFQTLMHVNLKTAKVTQENREQGNRKESIVGQAQDNEKRHKSMYSLVWKQYKERKKVSICLKMYKEKSQENKGKYLLWLGIKTMRKDTKVVFFALENNLKKKIVYLKMYKEKRQGVSYLVE